MKTGFADGGVVVPCGARCRQSRRQAYRTLRLALVELGLSAGGESPAPYKWDRFYEWLGSCGVKVPLKVAMGTFEGIRGLCTRDRQEAGTELLRIPKDILIDIRMVARHRVAALWATERIDEQFRLALWLLAELQEGDESAYAPYIQLLPNRAMFDDQGGPLDLWSDDERAQLKFPLLDELHRLREQKLGRVHDMITPKWSEKIGGTPPSLDELRTAVAVISSRVYRGEVIGDDVNMRLVPMVDMANHVHPFGENARKGVDEQGDFVVEATRSILPGHQVLVSYGKLNNPYLAQVHGFCIPQNPYDFAVMDVRRLLDITPEPLVDELLQKSLLMSQLDGSPSRWQPLDVAKNAITHLKDFVKLSTILQPRSNSNAHEDDIGHSVYRQLIRDSLDAFRDEVETDEQLINKLQIDVTGTGRGPSRRALMAVQIRLQQKLLLLQALE